MKLKDSEKPKALLLVCGIAGVFGLVVVRMNSLNAPQALPVQMQEASPQVSERPQTIFASNENSMIVLPPESPVTLINPFRRILPDPDGTPFKAKPTVTVTSQPDPVNYMPRPTREISSASAVQPVRLTSNEFAVEQARPDFKLDGLLTGADPVAVIKIGSTTYVVGKGQTVEGYIVKTIEESAVKLQRGKEVILLKLDGS